MGAWGLNIVESDDAYDFMDKMQPDLGFDLYELLRGEIEATEDFKKQFEKNKSQFHYLINKTDWDRGVYILVYIAFAKNLEVELDKVDLALFQEGYHTEMENINSWTNPKERKGFLDILKKSVDEKTKYLFSDKGLLEKMGMK